MSKTNPNLWFQRYSPKDVISNTAGFEQTDSRPTLKIPVKAHSFAIDSSG